MRQKELRLALICYGGVSLAIYMHGITKEIWHLARASRAFHSKNDKDRKLCRQQGESSALYLDLLEQIEDKFEVKLRVLPDILAGASAGGINAMFLARAIDTGQSLEPLTALWLSKADVNVLLAPDARPVSRFSKFWAEPIAWFLLKKKAEDAKANHIFQSSDEMRLKLSKFVRARWFEPPFGGEGFTATLTDALRQMSEGPIEERLLPDAQPLDLFITATDFTGHPEKLPIHSPANALEMEHRIAMHFSTRQRAAHPLHDNFGLVFAARATASFPGAFPPFSVNEIDLFLTRSHQKWLMREAFLNRFLPHYMKQNRVESAMLIDGSVLANAPFSLAMRALPNRPAAREVDRRFVYIDPRPDTRTEYRASDQAISSYNTAESRKHTKQKDYKIPGFFSTIIGAISNIPREQPIRDDLDKIAGRSERIIATRRVIDNLKPVVGNKVERTFGKTIFLDRPSARRLHIWRKKARERAEHEVGIGYAAYGQLRMRAIIEELTGTAIRLSGRTTSDYEKNVNTALWNMIDNSRLKQIHDVKSGGPINMAREFFAGHDLNYRIRRIRFLTRELALESDQSGKEYTIELEQMREAILRARALLIERETSDFLGDELYQAACNAIDDPTHFIGLLNTRRNLIQVDTQIDDLLARALSQLPKKPRRTLLLAYLGFPYFDVATLPLLQGEGLDEFDPIKVDRISPEDAKAIRADGTAAILKGTEFNNFGAFFSRTYRENDYLWGRLHGCERMIDILLSSLPSERQPDKKAIFQMKADIFYQILDIEEPRLTKVLPLIASLRQEIAAKMTAMK